MNLIFLIVGVVIVLYCIVACLCKKKNNTDDYSNNQYNDYESNPNTSLLGSMEESNYSIFSPSGIQQQPSNIPSYLPAGQQQPINQQPMTGMTGMNNTAYPINQYSNAEMPTQPSFLRFFNTYSLYNYQGITKQISWIEINLSF